MNRDLNIPTFYDDSREICPVSGISWPNGIEKCWLCLDGMTKPVFDGNSRKNSTAVFLQLDCTNRIKENSVENGE